MSILKLVSTAVLAATLAIGAAAPLSTSAFATDGGFQVPPTKQLKKSPNKFRLAKFSKGQKKTAKLVAIGAVIGAAGAALLNAYNENRD